jgi:hypothetical protein
MGNKGRTVTGTVMLVVGGMLSGRRLGCWTVAFLRSHPPRLHLSGAGRRLRRSLKPCVEDVKSQRFRSRIGLDQVSQSPVEDNEPQPLRIAC